MNLLSRVPVLVTTLLSVVLLFPGQAYAHQELLRSTPEAGATLSSPEQLLLVFNEAVELAVARLSLTGPNGPVALAPLTLDPDAATVLIGRIEGTLVPGGYTVNWQATGLDGHPVRGQYTFSIALGVPGSTEQTASALGTTAPGQEPPPAEHHDATTFPMESSFGAESPLYAGVRWLTFMGLLGVLGVVAFRLVVLPLVGRRQQSASLALLRPASDRAAQVGLGMVGLIAVAALLRLYAQSYALHGPQDAADLALIGTLLSRTTWGWGWLLQAGGVLVALFGFLLARKSSRTGWTLAAIGAVALAFTPGLSGHAAATPELTTLAILADGLHVIGAGGWLGSLLLVVIVGIPVAMRLAEGERAGAVASLVNAFSPTALFFAGLVVSTGVFAAWLHLGSVPALWQSTYGRALLVKLAVLSVVFGTGAYNFLRVKPALGDPVATQRLRRSAALELGVGVVVLAVTAVLVASSPPQDMPGMQRASAESTEVGR